MFPCVPQIGGPRGEKGQKGEPAIIEPVRSTWVWGFVGFFPLGKRCREFVLSGRKIPMKEFLGSFNLKHCNYIIFFKASRSDLNREGSARIPMKSLG